MYFYIKEGFKDHKVKYVSGTMLPISEIHECS